MRRVLIKTAIAATAAMAVLTAIAAIWQKDNIKAIYVSQTYTQEDIRGKMEEVKKTAEQEIKKYTSIEIKDIEPEDEDKIMAGEMTMEQAAQKYNLPLEVMKPKDNDNEGEMPIEEILEKKTNEQSGNVDAIIGEHIGCMYALKAKYIKELGQVEKQAKDDYIALPEAQRNTASKQKIAAKYIDYVLKLESSCDKEVEKVVESLKVKLSEYDKDEGIIEVLQKAYYDEKELKKSYYLSLF